MSDIDAQELTAFGSGKSEAEVAFDLLSKLKGQGVWGERNISSILDMYAECLDAAKGLRAYEGQKRVDVAIHTAAAKAMPKAAPQSAPMNRQPSVVAPQTAAPVVTPQAQPQPQSAPQQQPVHAQQQAVAQAYKPAG